MKTSAPFLPSSSPGSKLRVPPPDPPPSSFLPPFAFAGPSHRRGPFLSLRSSLLHHHGGNRYEVRDCRESHRLPDVCGLCYHGEYSTLPYLLQHFQGIAREDRVALGRSDSYCETDGGPLSVTRYGISSCASTSNTVAFGSRDGQRQRWVTSAPPPTSLRGFQLVVIFMKKLELRHAH